MSDNEKIGKYSRITGTDRENLKERVKVMYVKQEMSVREIGEEIGRSYGATHRLLVDAKVKFRPRGNRAAS